VVGVAELKRPTRVVVVDADNPLEEVRGEFFWREDHERQVQAARDAAYRAGYQDGLAAGSAHRPARVRVRVVRRSHVALKALGLLVAAAFLASLIGSSVR
jgi:hypothetical protein